jgi:hypothetical protein
MARVQSKFITSTSDGVSAPLGYTLQSDGSGNSSWQPSGSGSVPAYTNFASFPSASTAGNGALAIALDTNILYESNGTSWIVLAPYTGSSSFVAFASSPITGSGNVSSVVPTFTTFSSSPGFTFTPNITGTYKVYASIPLLPQGNNILSYGRIFNTSGSATLLQESWAVADGFKAGVTDPAFSGTAQSNYVLTAGVNYQFDIQGSNESGGQVALFPGSGQFYMFAEGISLNGAIKNNGSAFDIYSSSQVTTSSSTVLNGTFQTFDNSPAFTITPAISGTYKVYTSAGVFADANSETIVRIFNTVGGATLLEESQAMQYGGTQAGGQQSANDFQSTYELTSGITYIFVIQGKLVGSSGSLDGSVAPFYMFAEGVGLTNSNQQFPVNFKATGTGSWTTGNPIILPTVMWDSNSGYNPSTGQYTAPFDGYYQVGYNGNTTGSSQQVQLYVNGTVPNGQQEIILNTGTVGAVGASATIRMVKGDILTWVADSNFTTNFGFVWVNSATLNQGVLGPNGSSSGSAFAFFASNIVTTRSSSVSTTPGFTTADNSPAFTFTPTISGIYKVYSNCGLLSDVAGGAPSCRIFNTSGGATLLQESQGVSYSSAGSVESSAFCQSTYSLTAGTNYVFDIQIGGPNNSTVQLDGQISSFYMFAEGISLLSAINQTSVAALVGFAGTQIINAPAQVILDTVIADTNNAYNTSTGVYTIPSAGWYDITFQGSTSTGVHDNYTVYIYRNGTSIAYNDLPIGNTPNIGCNTTPSVSTKYLFSANDQITFYAANQNGNTTTWGGDITGMFFAISGIGTTGVSKIVKSNSTGASFAIPYNGSFNPILDTLSAPLSATVYCNGGDVEIGLQDDGSGNPGAITGDDRNNAFSTITMQIKRDGTVISSVYFYNQNNIAIHELAVPSSSYKYIDSPLPGNHTYTIEIMTSGSSTANSQVNYTLLYARPLA